MPLRKLTGAIVMILLLCGCGFLKELKLPVMKFFDTIAAGDIRNAYNQTSPAFQASTDFEQFFRFLETSGLMAYESGSWPSVSFENNTGQVKGTVDTTDGRVIPLVVHLVKSDAGWQIQRIELEQAGISQNTEPSNPLATPAAEAAPGIPDPATLTQMIEEAVVRLGEAINSDQYEPFYRWTAENWQRQIQPADLQNAFRTFKDNNVDITIVRGQTPSFTSDAAIDNDGLLVTEGVYQTTPYGVYFKLTFVNENGQWKLFGISVNAR